jgi:hypothetical protein
MAFIPADNVVAVFMEFTGPDDVIMGWTWNFRFVSGNLNVDNITELGALLADWYDTNMKSLQTAGHALQRIRLRDLTEENSFQVDYSTGLPIVGTRAGNSMPSNAAWALKLSTGLAGRSYRGRVYHFGFAEADISGNYIESSYAATVLSAFRQIQVDLAVDNFFQWGVLSRFRDGAPLLSGIFTPITSIVYTDLRVDTQRKRLPD